MCWLTVKNACRRQKDMHGFPKQSRNQLLGLFVDTKNQVFVSSLKNKIRGGYMVVGSYGKTEFNDPRAICLSVVLR